MADWVMATREGGTVCVFNFHKAMATYLDSLHESVVLKTQVVRELGMTEEQLDLDRTSFFAVGTPLHITFSVRKPTNTPSNTLPRLACGWYQTAISDCQIVPYVIARWLFQRPQFPN